MRLRNSSERQRASDKALEKALELDPTSSEAWALLGESKLSSWDWAGAEADFRRAVMLNPNNAHAHAGLGCFYYAMGRLDEGLSESQIAQGLDPRVDHLSEGLGLRREYDRDIAWLLKWVDQHPEANTYYQLHRAYVLKGMHKEAIKALVRSGELLGFSEAAAEIDRAFSTSGYEAAMRRYARALEDVDESKQLFKPGLTADAYAAVGDKERAFYWLEQAYERRDMIGSEPGLLFLKVNPMLDPLRSDPRFKDLVRRVGLPP
jgi:tetratricopeptide (TPR) repeat protein